MAADSFFAQNSEVLVNIFIVLFLLIFGIVCGKKGFARQVLSLLNGFVALIAAFFFCGAVSKLLNSVFGLDKLFYDLFADKFQGNAVFELEVSHDNILIACEQLGVPSFIISIIVGIFEKFSTAGCANVGDLLCSTSANVCSMCISFVLLFIVSLIVFSIVKKLVSNIVRLPLIREIDILLGTALGLIKGLVFLYIILFIVGLIPSELGGFIHDVKAAIESSTLVTFFYHPEWIAEFFSNTIGSLLSK